MSDLMGQYVGLRKFARSAESSFQFTEKSEIDVDLLILGTIERPRGGLSHAASGGNGIAKQDELGMTILGAFGWKNLGPRSLGIVKNEGDELNQRSFGRILSPVG